MVWQVGKNPEFTFSACCNCAWWSGEIALPLKVSWWNSKDVNDHNCHSVNITFLCFNFSLEIWFWKKNNV